MCLFASCLADVVMLPGLCFACLLRLCGVLLGVVCVLVMHVCVCVMFKHVCACCLSFV